MIRLNNRYVEIPTIIGLGAIGGWVCGFLIFSFSYFIGRSGDSPAPPVGNVDFVTMAGLALFYGVPLGVLLFSVGYWKFLRGLSVGAIVLLPFLATLGGGLIGAMATPIIAALLGIVSFFIACAYLQEKNSRRGHSTRP